jgi:signal transduction histidine kinase
MTSAGGRRRGLPTSWLVLLGALALTAAATISFAIGVRDRDDARFENAVQSAADLVAGRLDIYVALIRGGAALFAASDSVSQLEFRSYVERLEVQHWYPGIQGIGWTQRVEYRPGMPIDEQHAIRYLEPLDARNIAAIGFDMYSESVRRDAMQRARDSGTPALSGKVTLIQEIHGPQQPGFLLYVPVYESAGIPATVEDRRLQLTGFVYAPFRANDLFAGIFGGEALPRVSIAVYDGPQPHPDALLYTSPLDPDHRPRHAAVRHMEVAGRHWTVHFGSRREWERTSTRGFTPLVLLSGLIASFWLFRLAAGQARARRAAESAYQAKSRFLANMSHELRTPLNAIGGYVDLMQARIAGPVSDQQDEYLFRIQKAQQHLLGLINDVLNFARLDAGRVHYRLQPLRISELIEEVIALLSLQASANGIALTSSGGPDIRVLGDADKVRQVLINLVSNAIKFTNRDGRVDVYWNINGDAADIAIDDTGIGIPEAHRAIIFEPFLQVDTTLTRTWQGTGLGLAISRDLARGMNGDIRVESEEGAGSRFILSLPLAADDSVPVA